MPRFSLRTLIVVMLVAGPLSGAAWWIVLYGAFPLPLGVIRLAWAIVVLSCVVAYIAAVECLAQVAGWRLSETPKHLPR